MKYSVLNTAVAAASTVDTDGAAACGNDARQAVLLEPLPSGLNQGHQRTYVSVPMDMGSGLVGVQPCLELSRPKCSVACAEPCGDLQTRSRVA